MAALRKPHRRKYPASERPDRAVSYQCCTKHISAERAETGLSLRARNCRVVGVSGLSKIGSQKSPLWGVGPAWPPRDSLGCRNSWSRQSTFKRNFNGYAVSGAARLNLNFLSSNIETVNLLPLQSCAFCSIYHCMNNLCLS
jgi:hypothetical protein